jgi:hypothetical protein
MALLRPMQVGQWRTQSVDEGDRVRQRRVQMRRLAAAVLAPVCLALAGCGAAALPAPTSTLPSGTRVGPQVFLSDSSATAAAVRTFADALGANGPTLTAAQAKASATLLDQSFRQTQLGLNRLSTQQVSDSRLDAQREAIIGPLGVVVVEMSAIDAAAHAGNVPTLIAHLAPLRTAIGALQQAGAG